MSTAILPNDMAAQAVLTASAPQVGARVGSTGAEDSLAVINSLSFYLARSASIERIARHTIDHIHRILPAARITIWLRCRESGEARRILASCASEDIDDECKDYRHLTAHQWSAIASQSPILADGEDPQSPLCPLAVDESNTLSLGIALTASSGIVGVLVLQLEAGHAPTEAELALLETIATTAALALAASQRTLPDTVHATGDSIHRMLVDQLPEPVFLHDLSGQIVVSNPAMQALTGFRTDELSQHSIFELFGAEDADLIADQLTYLEHLAGEVPPSYGLVGPLPVDFKPAGGPSVHADLFLRAMKLDSLGDGLYFQALARDVSERERIQRELDAIQRIVSVMAEADDLDEAMAGVWSILTEAFGFRSGGIWTVSADGQELITRAASDEFELPSLPIDQGIIGRVVRERSAVYLPDVSLDPDFIRVNDAIVSAICVPILRKDRLIGVIDVESAGTYRLDKRDLRFLCSLATQLAGPIERAELYADLERQASTDLVTGLPNRHVFQQRLDQSLGASRRGPVSLLIIGVDHFKGVNELYGHIIADDLLRQIGQTLRARVRGTQTLGRYTSDTFTVLLPNVNRDAAVTVAETLRIGVATQLFMAAEQIEQLTISIGAATYPDDAAGAIELVQAADHAMYLAKRAGRNQTFQSNKAFATLAPHHGRITDLLRQAPRETLSMLVRAMDQRLPERKGHAERVTRYALAIARELGVPDAERPRIRLAAYIHDIGMVTLPDALLRKPGQLSTDERELLRSVPVEAGDLLAQLDIPDSTRLAVVHQREYWDGSGYPNGLAGEEIPLGARIIAVADAIDAMTSPRAHREPMTIEQALDQVTKQAGVQFDPAVTRAAGVLTAIAGPPAVTSGPTGEPAIDLDASQLEHVAD